MIRYSIPEMLGMLRTPLGRIQLREGAFQFLWPLFRLLAGIYRKYVIHDCCITVVIGSFGKTTTMRAIAAALDYPEEKITERNSLSHVAMSLLRIAPGTKYGVLEVGIEKPGQMGPYARLICPDIVVVTSIGSEHNRSMGDLETTRTEKAEMVRALKPCGIAILNGDNPHVLWMQSDTQGKTICAGVQQHNEVRLLDFSLDWPHGSRIKIDMHGTKVQLHTRFVGEHFGFSIMAALIVAKLNKVDMQSAIDRVGQLEPTHERLNTTKLANGAFIIRDAFKSAPETIQTMLEIMDKIHAKNKFLVLGDVSEPGGSQGPVYREIGARFAGVVDFCVLLGGRSQAYKTGAVHAGMSKSNIVDAGRSIQLATRILEEKIEQGDVVMIKGRYSQRLDRVALGLMGRKILCTKLSCDVRAVHCETCPMLDNTSQN